MKLGFLGLSESSNSRLCCMMSNGHGVYKTISCQTPFLLVPGTFQSEQCGFTLWQRSYLLNCNISKSTHLAWHPNVIFPLGMQYKVPGCQCSSWSRANKHCCTHTNACSATEMALRNRLLSQVWSKYMELTSKTAWANKSLWVSTWLNSKRACLDMICGACYVIHFCHCDFQAVTTQKP